MASTITFTDAGGAVTLTNGKAVPGDRFSGWTPSSRPFADPANALADGRLYVWDYRTDHGVSFELRGIRRGDVDLAIRCQLWLLGGGAITVNTGDASARSYTSLRLAPGTEPELEMSDSGSIEYTLRLSLIDTQATPVPLLCEYP
jgi:hypothetical protein